MITKYETVVIRIMMILATLFWIFTATLIVATIAWLIVEVLK